MLKSIIPQESYKPRIDQSKHDCLYIAVQSVDPHDSGDLSAFIFNWLHSLKLKVINTVDPHGELSHSKKIFDEIQQSKDYAKFEEYFMRMLLRRHFVDRVIEPAINTGHWVICNGHIDLIFAEAMVNGSLLYQDLVKAEHLFMNKTRQPDLVFTIDTPFYKAFNRARDNNDPTVLSSFERDLRSKYNRKRTELLIRTVAQHKTHVILDGSDTDDATRRASQIYIQAKTNLSLTLPDEYVYQAFVY